MNTKMIVEKKMAGLAPEVREGERSEPERTGGASPAAGKTSESRNGTMDCEVSAKTSCRRFPASYKLEVLREVEHCTKPGEIGALLRREGLYSSLLSSWRRQREAGEFDGLGGKKRGRDGAAREKLAAENKRLRRENQRLEGNLRKAEIVIDVQKKISELLGIPPNSSELDGND